MIEYLPFALIGLLAFFLKGVTGTGTTTVIVSLSSLLIPAKETIVLASLVNVFGGFAMLGVGSARLEKQFWIPIAIWMFVGSVIGAFILSIFPATAFSYLLGAVFFLVALNFLLQKRADTAFNSGSAQKASMLDNGVGAFAGFCGGLVGVNAPPLVAHFGKTLDKSRLRRLLVLIFIPAAIAQTVTFALSGMVTTETLLRGLSILPMMLLGIWLGNRVHLSISEQVFRRVLGVFLLFVSLKLLKFL